MLGGLETWLGGWMSLCVVFFGPMRLMWFWVHPCSALLMPPSQGKKKQQLNDFCSSTLFTLTRKDSTRWKREGYLCAFSKRCPFYPNKKKFNQTKGEGYLCASSKLESMSSSDPSSLADTISTLPFQTFVSIDLIGHELEIQPKLCLQWRWNYDQ